MSSTANFRKFRDGNSGAFTEEYHNLLGCTPWIVVKRLLRTPGSSEENNGGNSEELTEGDIATVFSQFGEVVDVRFVRHRRTGKFLGTAFVRFDNYKSGIFAADAMNSNFERNELIDFYSTEQFSSTNSTSRGILVERCDEAEVGNIHPAYESYEKWLANLSRSCIPSE